MRFDLLNCYKELQEEEGDNEITIRLGKTGSGKTVLQTFENVLPLLLDNQEVYCCYWLNYNGINLHYFKPKEFDKIKDLRNTTIVFDEIRRSFDPRQYGEETEEFRSFVELHRHRHNNIIGNTQDISLVAKTFGIQTHNWSLVAKQPRSIFSLMLDKIMERKRLFIQEDYLTYQELKKMAAGWEIGENVGLDSVWTLFKYEMKDLVRRDLNEIKVELVHKYCPRCKSRQGTQVIKEETLDYFNEIIDNKGELIGYTMKFKEYCPKHKATELIARESGMFDTDYEPATDEKNDNRRAVYYETCKVCGKDHVVK
ncbi:MAG: hypothetical protein ACOYMA_17505 [Bacteroidia bacterium]